MIGRSIVGLTECQSIDTFILWSMIYVGLGFVWGIVDYVARGFPSDWGKLEVAWLGMDFLQTAAFIGFYNWSWPTHVHKAEMFAIVCIIFLTADVIFLVTDKR